MSYAKTLRCISEVQCAKRCLKRRARLGAPAKRNIYESKILQLKCVKSLSKWIKYITYLSFRCLRRSLKIGANILRYRHLNASAAVFAILLTVELARVYCLGRLQPTCARRHAQGQKHQRFRHEFHFGTFSILWSGFTYFPNTAPFKDPSI